MAYVWNILQGNLMNNNNSKLTIVKIIKEMQSLYVKYHTISRTSCSPEC